MTFQQQCYRQKAANHRSIADPGGVDAKFGCRKLGSGDDDRLARDGVSCARWVASQRIDAKPIREVAESRGLSGLVLHGYVLEGLQVLSRVFSMR